MIGCLKACDSKPHYYDQQTALNILTTWVLPIIALLSNLPFETGRHHNLDEDEHGATTKEGVLTKLRRRDANFIPRTNFFEPLVNWIGSPQAALAGTLFSIHLLNRATAMVRAEERFHIAQADADKEADIGFEATARLKADRKDQMMALRNVLFVVCCVGQYEFLSPDDRKHADLESHPFTKELSKEKRRNRALLLGLLAPLCNLNEEPPPGLVILLRDSMISEHGNEQISWTFEDLDRVVRLTRALLPLLAHHLHLLRRRGMYPLTISLGWFIVAFAVGIYQSFRQVGDYTTAHSLAIGLLLSWVPVLVLMSIADRNPNGVERCTVSHWFDNESIHILK
jgi:hypothetical protein